MLAWKLKEETTNGGNKKVKQENAADISESVRFKAEEEDDEEDNVGSPRATNATRLPKSPWSPTAMKQKKSPSSTGKAVKKEKKTVKVKTAVTKPQDVKKPRSAYVLFSIEKRKE
uniref:HMG box domain-containing protein n=1 Tax=Globisporangium ultimum (strain ATCC 200006 / CBS 805.95 / DAOM BR144) TaxID=431595 RepID=K3WIC7_GLOUD